MTGVIRIGISGWTYPRWRGGAFYPKGIPQRLELSHAAALFSSIEINGTFYGLKRPPAFLSWHAQTPADFVFSVKAPRYITHMLKLKNAEAPLANFFASGLLGLEDKLGPILWQLPPQMGFDAARLESFFALLPRDTQAAAQLARRHDARLEGRALCRCDVRKPLQHALEVRHDSFRTPAFVDLLRRHNIGLVVADTVSWPLMTDVTSDFVYVRLHGSEELYVSGYEEDALLLWAERIRGWATGGRDVYVYFDNDAKVRAPHDALALIRIVASPPKGAQPSR